ncbi:MAG: glycosyltransferase family 4 protein [Desulfobacteraceae bacterium]|nr:glycosyltransferase family 4 protein [Desulfobacteraceae bacterium]
MTSAHDPQKLRILAIHRYYWPDTPPYASILRTIVSHWASEGHSVDVLSSQPSYKKDARIEKQPVEQVLDGVRVKRLDLPSEHGRPLTRLINAARFAWSIIFQACKNGPYDFIMSSTAPPVVFGSTACAAARLTGARFIYHCMDIHPEIGRISGEFRNPAVFSLLRRIDTVTCNSAYRVVVLSRNMKEAILRRPAATDSNISVINNFNLPSFSQDKNVALPEGLQKPEARFRLLFAGNIGRFQGLEAVVEAMHKIASKSDVELVFLGEGRAVKLLKSLAGPLLQDRIKFFSHQPIDITRRVIQTADLCLVTLTPGIYQFAFPSKTMTCLGEGRPLLVSVEPDSELADFVRQEKVGIAVSPNNPEELADAVVELVNDRKRLQEMALRARDTEKKYFDQEKILNKWSNLINEVAEKARNI